MSWFEDAPLWLIWLVISSALGLGYELGYRGFLHARKLGLADGEDKIGYLTSAALALLGLLIAFTFSMAVDRYDTRRNLIVEEANAVGTTYLRMQLLGEPTRTALSQMMLAYVEARSDFIAAGRNLTRIERADSNTEIAEEQLWGSLLPALAAQPNATVNPSLLEAANQMFDLAASNEAAVEAALPPVIINTLIVYAVMSAALIGYVSAANGFRHLIASILVFALFAGAISLTIDLDRPRRGSILVSVKPFERAANLIRVTEASKEGEGRSPRN